MRNTNEKIKNNYNNDINENNLDEIDLEYDTNCVYQNKKNKRIKLSSNVKNDILSNNGKIKIEVYEKDLNDKIIYNYKNKSTNKFYYQCTNRSKCRGKGYFDIEKGEFYITENCNNKKEHTNLNYNLIAKLLDEKKYNEIKFSVKKISKIYCKIFIYYK